MDGASLSQQVQNMTAATEVLVAHLRDQMTHRSAEMSQQGLLGQPDITCSIPLIPPIVPCLHLQGRKRPQLSAPGLMTSYIERAATGLGQHVRSLSCACCGLYLVFLFFPDWTGIGQALAGQGLPRPAKMIVWHCKRCVMDSTVLHASAGHLSCK